MFEEGALTTKDFLRLAQVRSKTYGFLSSAYLQIPERQFVARLISQEISSLCSAFPATGGLPGEVEKGLKDIARFVEVSRFRDPDEVCLSLSADRTRLLRGIKPGYSPPPPYESVYRDGEGNLMGRSAMEVAREYAGDGIAISDECREPPDHIGLELDFMRFLAEKEAECWEQEEPARALTYLDKERHFLREHLALWVSDFCDRVVDMAALDFYRGIARMTRGFIADDLEKIEGYIGMLKFSEQERGGVNNVEYSVP